MEGREGGKREEGGRGTEEVGKEGQRRERGRGRRGRGAPLQLHRRLTQKALYLLCCCHVKLLKTFIFKEVGGERDVGDGD